MKCAAIPRVRPRAALHASADRRISVHPAIDAPPAEPPPAELSAAGLAAGLRGLMNRAQDVCRLVNVVPRVQLVEHRTAAPLPDSGRMSLSGVNTCKSPLCPLCAPKWQRTRSDEISKAIDNHGADRVFFVTATMRHHRGMRLALMHRLQTNAWGNLFSGSGGQAFAAKLGGKPESIRAHDRTWSYARGWHPHVHCLLFVQHEGVDERELGAELDARWPKSLRRALKSFRALAMRVLTGAGCGREDCPECPKPAAERDECPHLRERATRMFGTRLVPRWRHVSKGVRVRASLHDAMRSILHDLRAFNDANITPTTEHGVKCERVANAERLPKYLAKMGLELASSATKMGHEGSDGITHYGLWEVARLACGDSPLRDPARRAWSDVFRATHGTQTITFSSRERLGLGEDPYADDAEPPERREGETEQCIGEIPSAVWKQLVKEKGHVLLAELAGAYARGELAELGYVEPVEGTQRGRPLKHDTTGLDVPIERPPPKVKPTLAEWRRAIEAPIDKPPLRVRTGDRFADAFDRGRARTRDESAAAAASTELPPFISEVRRSLREAIGGGKDGK